MSSSHESEQLLGLEDRTPHSGSSAGTFVLYGQKRPMPIVSQIDVGIHVSKDRLDAQTLADYGKTIQPRLFVGKNEERKKLSALVARRNQLNAMPGDQEPFRYTSIA